MLHGVPAGLFELRWAIVCPSCRTASELATSLDEVKPEGHCQLCDISFELDLDRAVEATFVPHEAVRKVENQMFCIGGPARTPHVWAQTNVEPNEARPSPRRASRGVTACSRAEGRPGAWRWRRGPVPRCAWPCTTGEFARRSARGSGGNDRRHQRERRKLAT